MKPFVMMVSASLAALALSSGAWAGESSRIEPSWIGAAHTPADHEALAKKFEEEAASFEKTGEMHKNLAETYRTQPGAKSWQAAQAKHCDKVAASLKTAAQEERAMAAAHHKMAGVAAQ